MSASHIQYVRELERAEANGVASLTPKQFEKVAKLHGWDAETIRLLLLPPTLGKTFLIGKEAYCLSE